MKETNGKVERRRHNGVLELHLNHAPSNILDFSFMDELSSALDDAAGVPLLMLTSGQPHFSSGVDVRIHTRELSPRMLGSFHEVIRKLYHHDGITVSLLHGNTLGGGMELALVCDFIFGRTDTVLGFPEIKLGCFPPVASVLLPRKIGSKGCKYLYGGDMLSAVAAEELGLIEAVFAESAEELLESIQQHSLAAMTILKRVLRRTAGFDFNAELATAENVYLKDLLRTEDMAEGVAAFLEKRKPRFQNR